MKENHQFRLCKGDVLCKVTITLLASLLLSSFSFFEKSNEDKIKDIDRQIDRENKIIDRELETAKDRVSSVPSKIIHGEFVDAGSKANSARDAWNTREEHKDRRDQLEKEKAELEKNRGE